MKKKLLCIMLCLCMTAAFAACGSDKDNDEDSYSVEKSIERSSEKESSTEENAKESSSDEKSSEEKDSESEKESSSEESSAEESGTASAEAGEKSYNLDDYTEPFVNFDDMHFYVNGKKYTLGETTLQEMIDDGVPFREKDLANAGNNLNPNYQSQGFQITLGDYYAAQVYTFNDTGDNKVTSECYINEIYLPVKVDTPQDILSFDFPLEITIEDLLARAGEPDESSHHDSDSGYYTDTFNYTRASEKYFADSKFKFEFTKGQLNYLYIEYMP